VIRLLYWVISTLNRWFSGKKRAEPSPPPSDLALGSNATGTFFDRSRNRRIPFRLHLPADASTPAPVVIFSPGLGGSRDAAPYLGAALAKAGYIGVFVQHPGSDSALIKGAADGTEARKRLKAATSDPKQAAQRFADIPFVVDQLEAMNAQGPLAGRINTGAIGIAGHSYGARTTLTAAGQRTGGWGTKFKEPRIRAAMPLSPIAQGSAAQNPEATYGSIDIPLFHVTGTEDGMPLEDKGGFDPRQRTMPFRLNPGRDQYLLVLDGANHNVFAGRKSESRTPADERIQKIVARGAVLFFDAYLKRDPEALRLFQQGFRTILAPGDTFEMK
jgi:predicted dienelactone hydrolase